MRAQRLDYALITTLEKDPVLSERLRRLRIIPGVGPITALSWALEIGDYTRFRSVKGEGGHQLLRIVQRGEEFCRQGDAERL